MKVLAEQAEGKMNSRVEYPSNHSRQQRKRNVDNLTFSNCGDTGFANPVTNCTFIYETFPRLLESSRDQTLKKNNRPTTMSNNRRHLVSNPWNCLPVGKSVDKWHFRAPKNIQLLRDMPSNFPQDSRLRCLWYVFY